MIRALPKRRWPRRALVGGLVLLALVAAGLAGNTVARYMGWVVAKDDPEQLSALISPYYQLLTPEGPGP